MPITHNLLIKIDDQSVDLGEITNSGIRISYSLEDPENFASKQASMALDIEVPATQENDQIFNTYYNPKVLDLTSGQVYSGYRACSVRVNGVELLRGRAVIENASYTRLQGAYNLSLYGQTGDWLLDARDLSLWDCLSTTPHTFDVATVEGSWTNFDSDEAHDFVYAPVRYRQPFNGTSFGHGTDDTVGIYHLRPSISIYWILIRAFRKLGYKVNSTFLNTANHFRRMVMPWTWGDFFDINNQLTNGVSFKANGDVLDMNANEPRPSTSSSSTRFWTGSTTGSGVGSTHGTSWNATGSSALGRVSGGLNSSGVIQPTGGMYIFTSGLEHFRITDTLPPNGFDNFGLYSFEDSTGTMIWTFTPPAPLAASIGNNVTINFLLNLLLIIQNTTSAQAMVALEVNHYNAGGTLLSSTANSIMPSGGTVVGSTPYPNSGSGPGVFIDPTVYNFSVPNVNAGDVLKFRLRALQDGGLGTSFNVYQAGYFDANPNATGASNWQYNPNTQQWAHINANVASALWQYTSSFLQMTGLEIQIGNSVNFQYYDKFRSYKFLDLLGGIIDMFNLSIQTDAISKVVTIEPTNDYVLPDGKHKGYFNAGILDWTNKVDLSKSNTNIRYKDVERQFDFSFKQDGSDGAQNIYAARYKGIYLNNVRGTQGNGINNTNNELGLIAGMPGASRYMFPQIFPSGNKQYTNRFFSATMHYKHQPWARINELLGGSPSDNVTPQLICIYPENINDSSASAVTQTFEPKIAFYAGKQSLAVGGWRWIGDPNAGGLNVPTYTDDGTPRAIGFQLPYMFAVDYTGWVNTVPGQLAPVLSYCDQNINGVVTPGLMKTYFLRRLAIMRRGKQRKLWMRLGLGDMTDWFHQNPILINGDLHYLIKIEGYNPVEDDSALCTFWKVAAPAQDDLDNMYPSSTSILTSPTTLAQFDLKYAQLLMFMSDIPTSG